AASLFILSVTQAYRAAEVNGYTNNRFRLHFIAAWGSAAIASFVSALGAVIGDFAFRERRDWLHYFGVTAWLTHAASVGLAFSSIIARFWTDLYYHLVG